MKGNRKRGTVEGWMNGSAVCGRFALLPTAQSAAPTSLERLHDIIMPDPVSWWPPAPGWIVVMLFATLVGFGLLIRWFVHWQRNAYRREALKILSEIEVQIGDPKKQSGALTDINSLLKRTSLTVWPREQVASLTGKEWLEFLDRSASMAEFSSEVGAVLGAGSFSVDSGSVDKERAAALIRICQQWLLRHRREDAAC
jgi:hypothetical protein